MESFIIVGIYLFLCLLSYIGTVMFFSKKGETPKSREFTMMFFGLMFPVLPPLLVVILITTIISKFVNLLLPKTI